MAEYINRQAALDLLWKDGRITTAGIKEIPAADVAPVRHGRWDESVDGDGVVCSVCGADFCAIIHETERFKFCPNCGAKMNEEDN